MMQGMTKDGTPLIVAVSGGIDSVVMLDVLSRQAFQKLIVAHVDHGIREDSHEDEKFVRKLALQYGCEFTSTRLELGRGVSEEQARAARFGWLEAVRERYHAGAIATAHHEDDVFETILINLSRGTGWRGLCSLRETPRRHRPLLPLSKAEIVAYALEHQLTWREDSTNESPRYLRNRIRQTIIPRLDSASRGRLRELYHAQLRLRQSLEDEVSIQLGRMSNAKEINRYQVTMIPDEVAVELLRTWLGESLERNRLYDLLLFVKTARPGSKWSLNGKQFVTAKVRTLIVSPPRD